MKQLISTMPLNMDFYPPFWIPNPMKLKILRIFTYQEKVEVCQLHIMKRMLNQNIAKVWIRIYRFPISHNQSSADRPVRTYVRVRCRLREMSPYMDTYLVTDASFFGQKRCPCPCSPNADVLNGQKPWEVNSLKRIESIHFGHEDSWHWQVDVEKCFKDTNVENLNCDFTYYDQTDKEYQL